VCNEAALIAARKGKNAVDMSDFQDAIDRVIGGLEKKNKIILPQDLREYYLEVNRQSMNQTSFSAQRGKSGDLLSY